MDDGALWILLKRRRGRTIWKLSQPYHVYKNKERAMKQAKQHESERLECIAVEYRRQPCTTQQ